MDAPVQSAVLLSSIRNYLEPKTRMALDSHQRQGHFYDLEKDGTEFFVPAERYAAYLRMLGEDAAADDVVATAHEFGTRFPDY